MPTTTAVPLTVPQHLYAHTEVQINDNTIRTYTRGENNNCKILAVFMSPKGPDRVMRTVSGTLDDFDAKYGVGSYAEYGQPLINARAAMNTGFVTLQCMRISAMDATYANNVVWVQYRSVEKSEDVNGNPVDGKLQVMFKILPIPEIREISEFYTIFNVMSADPDNFDTPEFLKKRLGKDAQGNQIELDCPSCPSGWRQMPLMGVISTGRGSFGNTISFRISNNPRADKISGYKNYYFRVFEGTTTVESPTRTTLIDDAIVNNQSLNFEAVINGLDNGTTGSENLRMKINDDAIATLYEAYTNEDLYHDQILNPKNKIPSYAFDPLLGIDIAKELSKSSAYKDYEEVVLATSGMPNFEIYTGEEGDGDIALHTVQFNTMSGIRLELGSDGAFALSSDPVKKEARRIAIRNAYYAAFTADQDYGYDPDIMSKTKYPLDAVFDADFPVGSPTLNSDFRKVVPEKGTPEYIEYVGKLSLKEALANLVDIRHEDCFCFMDMGTDRASMLDDKPGEETSFDTKEEAYNIAPEFNDYCNWWNYSLDAYYGKIRDPYTKKVITVTSTYNLIVNYPKMWRVYDGKHIPYAGSKYGVIDQYIENTVFPLYDVDLDATHLDNLMDVRVNYAQINSKRESIRGAQGTRYPQDDYGNFSALTMSNLSEINNALIILDIKKDAIRLVENYAYNFNESEQLALFNRDAEELVAKYANAQVKSISASFSRTDEEAELGILHLTIAVVHKALVKINLIDIDVNRAVET